MQSITSSLNIQIAPLQFQVIFWVQMGREKAIGIQEQDTVDDRKKFTIPDRNGLEPEESTPVYKRSIIARVGCNVLSLSVYRQLVPLHYALGLFQCWKLAQIEVLHANF